MRKILTFLFAALMSVGMWAAPIVVNGVQIGDLYYNLNNGNKTAEVTYHEYNTSTNYNYLTAVNIPESVEYYSVTYTVTSIGTRSFYNCSGLTSIEIPSSVTSIGERAFGYCSVLTSVECLGETPASLGNGVFYESNNLNAIYVPCGTLDAYQSSWTQYQSYIQSAQPEYTIIGNVNIAGAGTVILPQTICDNSITASPNYGYHFVQWSDGNTENPRTIELTQDTTFTAEFAKNEYTITTESANSEWGTAEGGTSALYLDNIQISALPNYGYHFVRWDDNNTSNPRTITVTEDKTYQAIFAKNSYSVSKQCDSEQGSISGDSQAEYLDEVTLTVTPNYGYHFVQWSDGVTENPRAFVLTQDTTFTAEFALDRTGTCGNDLALTWTYDPEGKVLTISGNGAFEQNIQCGVEARGEMTEVIFEDGVTSIGNSAFYECSGLTSITIPNSVISIGDLAFAFCSGLTSITIPNSVTSIGEGAFEVCTGLTSITIPNGVTSIEDHAFANCSKLTSVTIPNSVTSIGESAFISCSGLTSITIPNSVTSIGGGAFESCTGLTSIEIPSSVTSIGDYAFYACSGLTSITIPNSVTSIGESAFASCSGLTSVTIGNSVTSIGDYAFTYCSSLASFTINATTQPTLGSGAFGGTAAALTIYVPAESVDDYKAAAGWKDFAGRIVAIGDEPQEPEIVNPVQIGDLYYNLDADNQTAEVTYQVFFSETNYSYLTAVNIPESVEYNSVTYSVTSIGMAAFLGCSGLTSVTIPNSVSIGEYAFYACFGLTSVTNYATTPQTIGSDVFIEVDLSSCTLYVPEGSIGLYQAAEVWEDFGNIQAIADEPEPEPATQEITPNVDPQNPAVYYSTFYDSAKKYELPEGVEAYVATIGENVLNLTRIAVAGQVIPNGEAVILKSTVKPFTLTPSDAAPVTFTATNSLLGTDVATATPANCYVLGGADGVVGFYPYSGTNLNPHKAYVVFSGSNNAPRRMPFIFDAATGVENVQGNVQSTKVLRDGQLIIIRNGVEYNANGMMVK